MKTPPKHGRNAKRNANKIAKALYKLGGVESGNLRNKRKPGELRLPVVLASDARCKMPQPQCKHTQWIDGTMTDEELEGLWSRLADKQPQAFSSVA